MRDIAKVAGRPDLHDVDTWSGAIRPRFRPTAKPTPSAIPRPATAQPVISLASSSPTFWTLPPLYEQASRDQRVVAIESRKLGLNSLMAYTAKSSRFLPSASSETSHRGVRPRPVHVSPEGLRYLTATLVRLPPDFAGFPPMAAGRTLSGITVPTISASDIPRAWARAVTSSMKLRFSPSVFSSIRTVARWTTSRRATTPRPSRDFRSLSRSTRKRSASTATCLTASLTGDAFLPGEAFLAGAVFFACLAGVRAMETPDAGNRDIRKFCGMREGEPCCMCGRPLGCKRKNEKPAGWVDCDHVFGLSTRCHDRWPRWGPRSSAKHGCGFASRCNKRVLWIVGSTDRHLIQLFHPGINARFRRHRLLPVGRDARHRDPCQSGHLVVQSRPKPRGGSPPVMPQPPRW